MPQCAAEPGRPAPPAVTVGPATFPYGPSQAIHLIRHSGGVIGHLGVGPTRHGIAIDWEILKPADRRRGYAFAAQLLPLLRDCLVYAGILPDNQPSLALARRLAFAPVHPDRDSVCHHWRSEGPVGLQPVVDTPRRATLERGDRRNRIGGTRAREHFHRTATDRGRGQRPANAARGRRHPLRPPATDRRVAGLDGLPTHASRLLRRPDRPAGLVRKARHRSAHRPPGRSRRVQGGPRRPVRRPDDRPPAGGLVELVCVSAGKPARRGCQPGSWPATRSPRCAGPRSPACAARPSV